MSSTLQCLSRLLSHASNAVWKHLNLMLRPNDSVSKSLINGAICLTSGQLDVQPFLSRGFDRANKCFGLQLSSGTWSLNNFKSRCCGTATFLQRALVTLVFTMLLEPTKTTDKEKIVSSRNGPRDNQHTSIVCVWLILLVIQKWLIWQIQKCLIQNG